MTHETPRKWLVLVYRVPSEPSNARVSVWRELKRLGALYLQQCVCVLPDTPDLAAGLARARERIVRVGGSSNLFPVPHMAPDEEAALAQQFRELSAKQYAEIVEECETKFVKEVEFELFRQNFTFAEAEEIEQDLDKIRRWFARVQERDWFDAPGRTEVEAWIGRCEEMLDGFYDKVHARAAGHAGGPDASEVESGPRPVAPVPDLRETGPPRPRRAKRRPALD
jgi:hypothetical protein